MNRVVIAEHDFALLRQLEGDGLQQELDWAEVVPAEKLPGDVVTMHAPVAKNPAEMAAGVANVYT